ncbi:Beta sliding clamp [Hyella patelloides LEGE 07179]|uniref:Beta sliding clamp n=1 Tax=Hyella patelloides LEGE 07179 TaxID=945734 RepID=A0A563W397_9CYAN|nr:DNA polymerase III subunit beta [Hyella patelloides]VEP18097.1 Beta sliding clamp [Hyella patelloides LEGE 07179]
MKIICSQSDLKNNLAFVSRAVPARPEPLVLGNILLVADETSQKITMTAFDGSLGIRASFQGEVVDGGTVALPAKLFNDIVSRLPEMEITLDCGDGREEDTNLVATLSAASSKLQINGMDGSEFPELPTVASDNVVELPINILLEGLKGCLFAASTELAKQVLTGVHLSSSQDASADDAFLEFAATDSHRLSVVRAFFNDSEVEEDTQSDIAENLTDLAVTIPARALRELEKMVSEGQSTFKMRYDNSQIVFEAGERVLNTLRLTGAYPPYERLIPATFSRQITCDRKRLISSLELVSVLAQKNNIVKFSLNSTDEELTLSVDTPDVGSAKQSLPAEITGEDIDIAFNIKYLMDGIKAISSAEIKMQLNEWNQPVIFTPLSGLQVTYLVMPVQIRN